MVPRITENSDYTEKAKKAILYEKANFNVQYHIYIHIIQIPLTHHHEISKTTERIAMKFET
jgi:hypothetical protein